MPEDCKRSGLGARSSRRLPVSRRTDGPLTRRSSTCAGGARCFKGRGATELSGYRDSTVDRRQRRVAVVVVADTAPGRHVRYPLYTCVRRSIYGSVTTRLFRRRREIITDRFLRLGRPSRDCGCSPQDRRQPRLGGHVIEAEHNGVHMFPRAVGRGWRY